MRRPGTHYNHAMRPETTTWAQAIAAAQAAREACARGLHGDNLTTVTPRRVAFAAFGRRRPVGERYCTRCGRTVNETEQEEQEEPSNG